MEPITIAELLPGYEPYHEKNVNSVYKAQVHTDDQGEISAFVKSIPDHELLMECICALVGRALKLPIPKPLLVIVKPDSCPPGHDLRKPLFGCEEIQHPSVRRFVCPDGDIDPHFYQLFIDKISAWKQLADAALFDEQIANCDRNSGNYLFDGKTFHLIDHGLAMYILFNEAITIDSPIPDNSFLQILAQQDEISRKRSQNQIKPLLAQLGRIDISKAYEFSLFEKYADDPGLGQKMIETYRKRIEYITDIVFTQLGFKPENYNEYGTW